MSDFTNDMFSNRDEYCYAIELALDTAKMEAETVTTEINNPNNQSKEDTTMKTNQTNNCICTAHTARPVNGRYIVELRVSGNVAYAATKLPANYDINQWKFHVVRLCETHKRMVARGKAINVILPKTQAQIIHDERMAVINQNPIITNPSKEDNDMSDEYNYDYEHSFLNQVGKIMGKREIIDRKDVHYPTVIHELCDHEDCAENFSEFMTVEICPCCDLTPCPHYIAIPCMHQEYTWYEFGGFTHIGSEDMDCILACQLDGKYMFDTGDKFLADLPEVKTIEKPTCPQCKLLYIQWQFDIEYAPEQMQLAADEIMTHINNTNKTEDHKRHGGFDLDDPKITINNQKDNIMNNNKITIAKTRTSDGADNFWHIITLLDIAMLCRLNTEDWDSIEILQSQEITETLLHRVVGVCPKCIDHKRHGGFDIDDPKITNVPKEDIMNNNIPYGGIDIDDKIPNTNKEETMKTDIGIFTINHHEKGYVKCVKCSKELPISDPENDWSRGAYHRSVDEVRLCMTGNLDKPIETGFIVAKIWTGKQGDKMQTQYFAAKDRKLAVEFAKQVSGTMKTTKTGSIQVTYKLS